jgi:hypothetical protein
MNLKISIMLVLSISILAAVLVTGTVVNIVSAANSINVQTKTNLVTSTGSPHIVSSPAHGINVQTKTNQHAVTRTGSAHIVSSAAHGTKCKSGPCPNGVWGSRFTEFKVFSCTSCSGSPPPYEYKGKLVGETFSGVWYGIKSAPIHIGIAYRDGHCCLPYPDSGGGWMGARTEIPYNGHPGQTGDGIFDGIFAACDNPKAKDHTVYVTAYFDGGRAMNVDTSPGSTGRDTAYDYDSTTSLHDLGGNSRLFNIDSCQYGQHTAPK